MSSRGSRVGSTTDWESIFLPLLIIAIIIVTVASSSSDISSGLIGNAIAFLTYLLFLFIFIITHKLIYLPKGPALAFVTIYSLFIIGIIRDISGLVNHSELYVYPNSNTQLILGLADVIGYILASFVLVFLIPKKLRRDQFIITVVSISTISILLGLPAYLIGDYNFLGININTYTSLEPLRQLGFQIPALASFWGDANAMSKITIAGLLGSHYLYVKKDSNIFLFLIILNALGLFLANSRMTIIAAVVSYSVYYVYIVFDETTTAAYLLISGFIGTTLFSLIVFGVGTDIFIPSSGLSGRIDLWRGSIVSFSDHPIIGIGIHNVGEAISANTGVSPLAPQNSYLRIFVAGGIIGGGMYIFVIILAVFKYLKIIESKTDLLIFCLLIGFILIQFTDTAHPFGVNKNALLFGITLGYILDQVYSN